MMDAPSVSPSALSGARSSPNSPFASRPMRQSAPAQNPTQPSPVASQKSGASKRTTLHVFRSIAFTAAIAPTSFVSTPNARVETLRSMFFSSETILIRRASLSARFSSCILNRPRSSATIGCFISPALHTRISADAFPPRMGRSCTSATFMPRRAAATAAHVPASPPPTTTKSALTVSATAAAPTFSAPSGLAPPIENTMPAHRPSKPVKSSSATVARAPAIFTVPPSSQDHSREPAPKTLPSGRPSTSTRNLPGDPSAQLRDLTHTRYSPFFGNATSALASRTRSPRPCASRYGEPITSMNCESRLQPPASKLCGGTSTRASAPPAPTAAASRIDAKIIQLHLARLQDQDTAPSPEDQAPSMRRFDAREPDGAVATLRIPGLRPHLGRDTAGRRDLAGQTNEG